MKCTILVLILSSLPALPVLSVEEQSGNLKSWEPSTFRSLALLRLSNNSTTPSPCCTLSGIHRILMHSLRWRKGTQAGRWVMNN